MNILGIYKKYQIMPQLAEHQLRVAAVGEMICEHINVEVNKHDVVAACLLHDMGNIIKFDLTKTASLLNTNIDLEFWQQVQNQFKERYGDDEHHASLEIARELGVSERVIDLVDCIGFGTAQNNAALPDMEKKICAYSDMRVAPRGVVPLEERLADLRVRYDQKFRQMGSDEAKRASFENGLRQIEQQIFIHCDITPAVIMEHTVAPIKERLEKFEI